MFTWRGRRVAITGATGFVGHHAALELHRHGAELVALVRPSSDVRRLTAAGIACQIAPLDEVSSLARVLQHCEVVIHVAGAVGFGSDWAPFYQGNVEATRNIVNVARLVRVRRFVHISSISAIGASTTPSVLDEQSIWNLGHYRVPYVTTKRWAEEAALAANRSDLEVIVVNPGSVVGPDDFTGSEFGTLCKRFWRGRIPFHFGGGNNFVDVRDVARGIRFAAEAGRPGERYLLTGENRTYQSFFGELSRAAGRAIPRFRLPSALAPWIGYLNERFHRSASKRPYLTSGQAVLMGLYFFFDAGKAGRELGYTSRPLRESLADAHAFWMPSSHRNAA